MGVKERRERERQELRQQILAAALDIAASEGGWQSVTIRKVADRIEYSPPTIYEHFVSKEAILLELMRQGFAQMLEALRAACAAERDPAQALLAMSQSYWEFAFVHPELYQVMHGLGGVPFADNVQAKAAKSLEIADQVFDLLCSVLQDLVQGRGAEIEDVEEAGEIIWGMVHGLISLTMTGALSEGRSAQLTQQSMRYLLTAWGVRL